MRSDNQWFSQWLYWIKFLRFLDKFFQILTLLLIALLLIWINHWHILTLHPGQSEQSTLSERIYQLNLYHSEAQSLQSLPDFLNPLLYSHSLCSKPPRRGRKQGEGWLAKSTACHEWIYGWGDSGGRRSNWWVTHNQPPYRSPAKLDCIQRLVIRPDLANVSHSSPEPRQLSVIRAWPGLPFLLPLSSTPPSTSSAVPSVSWQRGRWRFVDQVHLSFPPPFALASSTIPSKLSTTKSANVLLKSLPTVSILPSGRELNPLTCLCC